MTASRADDEASLPELPDDPASPAILWLRDDLRLADNPALSAAVRSNRPVVPLYILEEARDKRPIGSASRWWLHHSLDQLSSAFARKGAALILRRGDPEEVLAHLVAELGSDALFWNRRYGRAGQRDRELADLLHSQGVKVEEHQATLLHDPDLHLTGNGGHYRVFTPFWRRLAAAGPPRAPLPAPREIRGIGHDLKSNRLVDWKLLPSKPNWASGFDGLWEPGEDGAGKRLGRFIDGRLARYHEGRDRPDHEGTSAISPHLRFGEISPVQIWHAVERADQGRNGDKFLSELAWRDFSYHLLEHRPDLGERNFNAKFDDFPWQSDDGALRAWQRGSTGYPIVDAGMRQLWHTGWMHNRVRLIAASFLVKDLMIDWRTGAAWFWDTLLDADPANNSASWQWVAGSGADAAPYFRIFNPVLQGERFDPDGGYVRRWVPELSKLPPKYIHRPWEAPAAVLESAGVVLGDTYPSPIVNHKIARQRALAVFQGLPQR